MSQHTTDRSFDDLARALAEGSISRRGALKLFAGTAIAALIPSRALAQQKVTICHKPGTPDEQTIEVSQRAVATHLGHGDHTGQCTTTTTSTTSTSTTPICIPLGGRPCTDFTQCCSNGLCVGETCCATRDQACTADSECCSGNCDTTSGTCACLPNGSNCDFDLQCCGEVCNGGICCSKPHGSCDTDDDCCTGFCTFHACEPCRADGDPCTLDGECCSGAFCVNGTCTVCQSTGGQCDTDSQCCTGACLSGTCTDCMPDESQCTTDTECCNGNCFQGFCVPRNRIECGCENGAAVACTSTDCSDATAVNQLCTALCAQGGGGAAVPELSECIPEGCVS